MSLKISEIPRGNTPSVPELSQSGGSQPRAPQPATPQTSRKGLFLLFLKAFLIGFVLTILAFLCFFFWADFPTLWDWKISKSLWRFFSSLLATAVFAYFVLLVVDKFATNISNGTRKAMYLAFFGLTVWFFGFSSFYEKPEKEDKMENTISNPNPFGSRIPAYTFTLDRGEKSLWIDFPASYIMDTWGNHSYYKIIYRDGSVFTVDGNKLINLPKIDATQVRIESLSDGQTIYVYLKKR